MDTQVQTPIRLDASSGNFEYLRVLLAGIFEEEATLYLCKTNLGLHVTCDISLLEEPGISWVSFTETGNAAEVATRIKRVFRELTNDQIRMMNPEALINTLGRPEGFRILSGMWKDTLVLRVIPDHA
jgi:hypothetical protein